MRRDARRFAAADTTASDALGGGDPLAAGGPFVTDLERVQFSPYFSRLSAVTQVVSPSTAGAPVHNRLTHTMKVASVARSIAERIGDTDAGPCDPTVVEAAACAHDLGHPPFGHLGEAVLNRIARDELGLADGFEGNAQTYRIIASLDVIESAPSGLDLTAATRAAIAKYPWSPRVDVRALHHADSVPRGIHRTGADHDVFKYSAYFVDEADLDDAREQVEARPLRQTAEGAVMDISDDIAYSVHDIDDFYRAGILDHASVTAEFHGWLDDVPSWAAASSHDLTGSSAPGAALERLRRKVDRDDPWIAEDDAFYDAVWAVNAELVDALLIRPFDGSLALERELAAFTGRWIRGFVDSVGVVTGDSLRTGPLSLGPAAWHRVEILKFLHRQFVLSRPDLAIQQRGLSTVISRTVRALIEWMDDEHDRHRVPRRLRELIDLAHEDYAAMDATRYRAVAAWRPVDELSRARGVIDYVASLTDAQAADLSDALSGRGDRIWSLGHRV
ncbi:dGTPase [Leifsonia sp. LS1]|uniref:deoxyguanosinetriphosphate triphosphohydrolase family protein n=1 Tax=Leifsonia sp. LS1 TaxID=2828483 RepID=UPI001CFEA1F3|nr:dNTP triphosphohydrolase [Leifsonia sp. LS1]GIT78730.1 dGTPase [Leifsonia sp. LS1]